MQVRFWAKVDKRGQDECWEWQGAKHDTAAYGVIGLGERGLGLGRAHRLSYCWAHGLDLWAIAGKLVMHSCDNPACVNPAHLSLGTDLDNQRDKCRKGRLVVRRGSSNPWAKLSEADVLEIRRTHDPSWHSGFGYKALAKRYGVTSGVIRKIVKREGWTHV